MNIFYVHDVVDLLSLILSTICVKHPKQHLYNIDKIDYCSNTKNVADHSNYTFIYGNVCDLETLKLFIVININFNL